MTMADEIQKLQQLREQGALTSEEFDQAKARILAEDAASRQWNQAESRDRGTEATPVPPSAPRPRHPDEDSRQWTLFLHLSQFAGFVIPFGGLILPLVLWQVKKVELPLTDAHGQVILNWQISSLIYFALCIPLCFILVGIPLLLALLACGLIFPIIGAIRANEGVLWRYPMSIPFFKG